ncbi:MAG: tRNA lysidine(34) synthetase TilS [Acidobacteriota bacterium]
MSAQSAFQKVQSFIKTHALLAETTGIVIALSGGPDSIALLDILIRLQKAFRKNRKHAQEFNLHIAHLNHQLRGKASDEDAEFVRRLADKLEIPATVAALDINQLAETTRCGVEETARLARYRFLLDTAMQTGCNRIATGHTMSDQAETFLMRLARGAGLRGLASMRPMIPAHQFRDESEVSGVDEQDSGFRIQDSGDNRQQNDSSLAIANHQLPPAIRHPQFELPNAYCLLPTEIKLIRPLLAISREEVEQYCRKRHLAFRLDATNESLDYTRNRIRHEVLKVLREINPRIIEHLAQTAEIIALDDDALNQLTAELLGKAQIPSTIEAPNEKGIALSIVEILPHPQGVRRRLLIAATQQAQEKLLPPHSPVSAIESTHIKALEHLLVEGVSGDHVQLMDAIEVWREFNSLVFISTLKPDKPVVIKHQTPDENFNSKTFIEVNLNQPEQIIEAGEFRLQINRHQPIANLKEVIRQNQKIKERSGMDWFKVALDDARLPDHLILRTRQAGEKVRVVGQAKIKKLKNLMIDHKIPASRRATWLILATSDGEYVWSPGLPPALKFTANEQMPSIAIVQVLNTGF